MKDRYQIRILGLLDPSWSDRLGGMAIVQHGEADPPSTTLTGSLTDQSALTGVINALVDLRQTVISVERLDSASGNHVTGPTASGAEKQR
jgi:hypothetical protein